LAKRIEGDEYIVCATMDAETDRKIVHAVLDRGLDLPYVGVVGDREKRKEIAQALVADGVAKERALSVRCPIGLPLASREPGEVAIAIAAEMIQVRESLTGA
ncbi:MAG: XdhC family protein, partial [Planctomycetota bacterium]